MTVVRSSLSITQPMRWAHLSLPHDASVADMNDIHFPEKVTLKNHFNERKLHLTRADCISSVPSVRARVTSICNQSTVYRNLFQERLKGARYTLSDADEFLAWATAGWKLSTHFVFFIIDDQFGIVGAIDIKSAELDNAEIGYWADSNHPGNITNAVLAMIDSAIENRLYSIYRICTA